MVGIGASVCGPHDEIIRFSHMMSARLHRLLCIMTAVLAGLRCSRRGRTAEDLLATALR